MKKFPLAILFLLLELNSNAQWNQICTTGWAQQAVCFTSATTGYTTGQIGQTRKTTNAGVSWFTVPASGFYAYALDFTDANTGYIAGGYQTIKKTSNAGTSWVIQDTGTSAFYISIHFPNTDTGYAVGSSGLLKKTVNGGTNWIAQVSGTGQTLNSVFFVNTSTGYIAGNGGVIRKTTDGGTTWVSQTSGTANALFGIYFTDLLTGYAVGSGGVIKKTIDGGATWVTETSSATAQLNCVHFVDSDTGYIAGNNGMILKTIDAGSNWLVQLTGISTNLNSISFTDAITGYIAGGYSQSSDGKVLKTTNGGGPTYPCTPAYISLQPQNSMVCAGHTTSFTVNAHGYTPFTYKWYKNGVLVDSTVTSTLTNTYTTPVLSTADSGNVYYCVINNTCPGGTIYQVTTNTVYLTVNVACTPLTLVSANPTGPIAGNPGSYTCTMVVAGTPPFIYKWYLNGNLYQTDTLFSTTDSYTFFAYTSSYSVSCTVTNCNSCGTIGGGLGSVTHGWALSIQCPITYLTTQPANQTKTTCQTATFNVAITGNAVGYQWYKNGVAISGAISSSYTTSLLTLANNGNTYYCYVYYYCQPPSNYYLQSNTATLTISTPASIILQPLNQTITSGNSATFSISVSGTPNFSYYCYKNGVLISSTLNTSTASSIYTTPVLTVADNGSTYYCKVTNGTGCYITYSDTVLLSVICAPVTVNSSTICSGQTANLTASGASTYTWSAGATSTGVNTATASPAVTTTYTVTGTSNNCSSTAISSVTVNSSPIITVNSPTICVGQTAMLIANGGGSYVWSTGAAPINIDSATASPLSTTSYTVTGTGGNGCSGTAISTVIVNPSSAITVNSPTICFGQTAALTASGGSSYIWSSGATSTGVNSADVTPSATTSYTVTGTNACGTDSTIATVTVIPTITPSVSIVLTFGTNPQCAGTSAMFTATPVNGGTLPVYQWYINGNNTGSNSNTFTTTSLSNNDIITCRMTSNEMCASPILVISDSKTMMLYPTYDSIENQSICTGQTYIWHGTHYSSSGTYTASYFTTNGCDSVLALNLSVNNNINTTVTTAGDTLISNQNGATYQWMDCEFGNLIITGETNQSYIVNANGQYAVAINLGGCVDTSACVPFYSVRLNSTIVNQQSAIIISPNPFTSQTTITFNEEQKNTNVKITDVLGNIIQQSTISNQKSLTIDMSGYAKGIYFVEVKTEKGMVNRKIIKN